MWAFIKMKSLLKLLMFLNMVFCSCGVREIRVKMIPAKRQMDKPVAFKVGRNLMECVYSCLQLRECVSVRFNKTNAACHLYDSHSNVTRCRNSPVLSAVLRKVPFGKPLSRYSGPITSERIVVLKVGNMTWRNAQAACRRDNSILHVINNDVEQKRAVKMASESGLKHVAIGVFLKNLFWQNSYKKYITYHDWGEEEPSWIGVYVVLSKSMGYKWEAITANELVSARMCEK